MPDYRDEYRKEWNKELKDKRMEPKCSNCDCPLTDDNMQL